MIEVGEYDLNTTTCQSSTLRGKTSGIFYFTFKYNYLSKFNIENTLKVELMFIFKYNYLSKFNF